MLFKKVLASALTAGMLLTGCSAPMTGSLQRTNAQAMKAFSLASIDNAVSKVGVHQESSDNALHLNVDGPESFAALTEMIRSAKKAVYAEYFIWHNDKTGKNICDLLIEKKKQGLEVKVLIDFIGCHSEDTKVIDRFRAGGIEVQRYPMLTLTGIFNGAGSGITLTHRKLMIVDGNHCMTGGINMGDEYANEGAYHDLMLQVEGTAARDMMKEFFTDWKFAGGSTPQWKETSEMPKLGDSRVRLAVTSPTEKDRRHEWFDVLTAAIDSAAKEIDIESPYFSDDELMAHLKAAAKRGVKVKVVVAIAHNDDELFKRLNVESARQLMEVGAEIRSYPGQRFSHTKYTCIDDCWTAIGTANYDGRSFRENQEIMAVVSGEGFASTAQAKVFDKDWAIARPMGTLKTNNMKKHLWNTFLELIDYYL
jgi:cardiolipin synthase